MKKIGFILFLLLFASVSLAAVKLIYVCPTNALGGSTDPVNKILADLGVNPRNMMVFYGSTKALVRVDVSTAEATKIVAHKDVVKINDVTKVASDYASDIGKFGVAKELRWFLAPVSPDPTPEVTTTTTTTIPPTAEAGNP